MTHPEIAQRICRSTDRITEWRRHLHRHPELSHQEKETAAFVVRTLESLGIRQITTGVGGYGVVAEIDSGRPGKMVGIRADMDALPIQEEVVCDFTSENPGVMHSCGHDAHTAMLLGAAEVLKEMADRGEFPGKIRLIFQPAEEKMNAEGKSGGRLMVEQGVLEGLSMVMGQHVSPAVEVGKISFQRGCITAASDSFELVVRGRASHGAQPHLGVDSITIAAAIIQGVQQIVSRAVSPMESGLITIGSIHGGTAGNIIAEEVRMRGTIRSFTPEVRDTLLTEFRRVTTGIAEALRGTVDHGLLEGYPAGSNDIAITDLAEETVRAALGDAAINPPIGPGAGAEDFAFMSREVPGTFLRLGVKSPEWEKPFNAHTPLFRIDERCLPVGATALVAVAVEYLRRNS